MSALLFGSISTVADTSELQRAAFNEAFAAHGLDWRWDRTAYRDMLTGNGGADRIARFAAERGQSVDARAIHDTKSKIFQDGLPTAGLVARPGVADAIAAAQRAGWKVGLVTTTSRANVTALLEALRGQLPAGELDVTVDSSDVEEPKPDPAAYDYAVRTLGERPAGCVAIEDNVGGVAAATAAGLSCVAFPNANTIGHDFGGAPVVERVDFAELARMTAAT